MGLCATPSRQEAVADTGDRRSLECRGCDGMRGMVISTDCPMCRVRICMCPSVMAERGRGGAHDGRCPMGRGNHTMILPIYHELNGLIG